MLVHCGGTPNHRFLFSPTQDRHLVFNIPVKARALRDPQHPPSCPIFGIRVVSGLRMSRASAGCIRYQTSEYVFEQLVAQLISVGVMRVKSSPSRINGSQRDAAAAQAGECRSSPHTCATFSPIARSFSSIIISGLGANV